MVNDRQRMGGHLHPESHTFVSDTSSSHTRLYHAHLHRTMVLTETHLHSYLICNIKEQHWSSSRSLPCFQRFGCRLSEESWDGLDGISRHINKWLTHFLRAWASSRIFSNVVLSGSEFLFSFLPQCSTMTIVLRWVPVCCLLNAGKCSCLPKQCLFLLAILINCERKHRKRIEGNFCVSPNSDIVCCYLGSIPDNNTQGPSSLMTLAVLVSLATFEKWIFTLSVSRFQRHSYHTTAEGKD